MFNSLLGFRVRSSIIPCQIVPIEFDSSKGCIFSPAGVLAVQASGTHCAHLSSAGGGREATISNHQVSEITTTLAVNLQECTV